MYDDNLHLGVFRSAGEYLFRGAMPSASYPTPYAGINVTPTSIDPIVATLYAARCRGEGEAVILLAETNKFSSRLDGPSASTFAGIEMAVNLDLPPMEFEDLASIVLPIDRSLEILLTLGFDLPAKLCDLDALRRAISDSPRLTADQVRQYVDMAKR